MQTQYEGDMTENNGAGGLALDAVRRTQSATMYPEILFQSGAGKAFQFVAQSAAMAVQDATDNLRNLSTLSTTAIGVAMSQLMSSGDVKTWVPVILAAQEIVKQSTTDFQQIGQFAAQVVKEFPAGDKAKSSGQ
jgi:hypothetical protein